MPKTNTGEIRVFVRVRDKQGGAGGGEGIQLFSIIQNATSKVEVVRPPHDCVASEIRSGTKRHTGMHHF